MAIEKMSLVNIVGNMPDLDKALLKCLQSECFQPENAIHNAEAEKGGFQTLSTDNPYPALLSRAVKLMKDFSLEPTKCEVDANSLNPKRIDAFLLEVEEKTSALSEKKRKIEEDIQNHEKAINQITHLAGLNVSFDDIFACQYVKVRFGRMPVDSFGKLEYYDNRTFFYFPFDHDDEYYWGVYFAPASKIAVVDDIFASLYFERDRVPDYAHGTPEVATNNINSLLAVEKDELENTIKELASLKCEFDSKLNEIYHLLKLANATYELRRHVAVLNDKFYVVGFIPKAEEDRFFKLFEDFDDFLCKFKPQNADPTLEPPVRLKNNRFAQPFESFVNMYSLPSHGDIDPTNLVAITYTILFGIMFGDLGQGLVMSLIGYIVWKMKKMPLGRVMIRIGFSSAFFGILYGSVFGYEELLDPMYKSLFGMATKPIHVFDTATTNMLLMGAIALGAVLIIISICINIYLGFKAKDYGRAIFGHNGLAGLTFYCAVAFAAVATLALKINVLKPWYVICFLILPILIIFLKEPLTKIVKRRKDFMPKNIGEFIIENFFELFEYVLSYLSNSMSFLRVGGFILSHAGMMAVVMSLAEMTGGMASPIVIIIGNIFVMCLEGLIVGIQVLRLEFYEIFSRNFEGSGKPFEPVKVSFEIEK